MLPANGLPPCAHAERVQTRAVELRPGGWRYVQAAQAAKSVGARSPARTRHPACEPYRLWRSLPENIVEAEQPIEQRADDEQRPFRDAVALAGLFDVTDHRLLADVEDPADFPV